MFLPYLFILITTLSRSMTLALYSMLKIKTFKITATYVGSPSFSYDNENISYNSV